MISRFIALTTIAFVAVSGVAQGSITFTLGSRNFEVKWEDDFSIPVNASRSSDGYIPGSDWWLNESSKAGSSANINSGRMYGSLNKGGSLSNTALAGIYSGWTEWAYLFSVKVASNGGHSGRQEAIFQGAHDPWGRPTPAATT